MLMRYLHNSCGIIAIETAASRVQPSDNSSLFRARREDEISRRWPRPGSLFLGRDAAAGELHLDRSEWIHAVAAGRSPRQACTRAPSAAADSKRAGARIAGESPCEPAGPQAEAQAVAVANSGGADFIDDFPSLSGPSLYRSAPPA